MNHTQILSIEVYLDTAEVANVAVRNDWKVAAWQDILRTRHDYGHQAKCFEYRKQNLAVHC